MKKTESFTQNGRSLYKYLPLFAAALAFVLTGCPRNQYIVQLKPQGDRIERTLIFYCEDGVNAKTGTPNYKAFDAAELTAIAALYPAQGLTNEGERHIARVYSPMNYPRMSAARALTPISSPAWERLAFTWNDFVEMTIWPA